MATRAFLFPLVVAGGVLAEPVTGERHRPPETVSCPRDHLTSYTGRIVSYRRAPREVALRIRTDWDSTELVRLVPPAGEDLLRYLLLNGRPFDARDWPRIESARGTLRPAMRVTAWVCDDGRPPVLDWQPPETREEKPEITGGTG